MRCIGALTDSLQAKSFSDLLTLSVIEHQIQQEGSGQWEIWINSEDQIFRAKDMLADFLRSPQAALEPDMVRHADAMRQKITDEHKKNQNATIDVRTQWRRGVLAGSTPVTLVLIAISVLVALYSQLGSDHASVLYLFITEYRVEGLHLEYLADLPEIRAGQIWRLVTPVFLHFGFMHVFFNLMWLKDLGFAIEKVKGGLFFLFLFLVTAIPSNLGQYYMSGPSFGGMSGVVYGFLGYVWMKGRFDPSSGLVLMPGIVTMMMVWFVLCLTGILGPVANMAHGVGLVVGVLVGFVEARVWRRIRR